MRFLALVSNGERLAELSEKAANSQDAATLQVLKTMDSIEAKTQQLQTSLQSLYTSTGIQNLFKGLLDFGNDIINTFTKMPTVFNLPLVAIAKFGTQFYTLANVVTTVFGLIKSRLTMQSKILQGQMTNDAKTGEMTRVQISQEEMSELQAILEQGPEARAKLEERMTQIAQKGANDRTNIAKGEAAGISRAQTKGGLIASAAGSALSLLSSTMGENTQAQRNAKGLTDLAGSVLSGVGTGMMIGGPAGAAVGALTVLPGLITSISTIVETAAEREERLKKAVEETNNTYLQRKDEAKTLEEQIEKLEELEKAQNDSAEAKAEFVELSNQIAEQHPELITGFDLEGNALIDLTSSYYALKQAREAANEAAKETAKASVAQADNNLKEAEENRQEALDSYTERLKSGYNSSQIEQLISIAKNSGYDFGEEEEKNIRKLANNGYTSTEDMQNMLVYQLGDELDALRDAYESIGLDLNQALYDIIREDGNQKTSSISSLLTDSTEKTLMESIEKALLGDDTEKVVNLINEKREEINKIRDKLESDSDKTNDWAVEYLNSILEINGEVTGVMADAAKAAKVRESVVRSQLSSLSSSMLKAQENDIGNEYLKEIENVNSFVTQYLSQKYSKSGMEFDDYVDKQLGEDLLDAQEILKEIWDNLGSSFNRDKFNQLVRNSKNYSYDQMKDELRILGLDNEEISQTLYGIYGDRLTQSITNFNEAVKKRLENDSGELVKTLDTFSRSGMGETDFSAILDKYDQLKEMVAGGAITDNYAASLLQQYKDLLDASKTIKDTNQREQVQSALQELDLTSLESVDTFIETMTEIGFLDEQTAKALREAVPVNLNTEVNTYVEKISSEMEDFESALSKATSGMKYKDAAAIAAKMGVSVEDFRQVGDKFFIDDLDALEKAYFDTSNDLVEGLRGKIQNLSNGLGNLKKGILSDEKVQADDFDAASEDFKEELSSTLQEAGVSVNLESLNLENIRDQWLKINENIRGSFIDYLIQQLTSSLEEAEKVQKVINTQKAEGYLAQGNFTKFLENLDLDKEQRSRAQEAFDAGNLDEVFDIIPQYADKITETFKKINQDIYNRMISETSGDNWIQQTDTNKELLAELNKNGFVKHIKYDKETGNLYYKLSEITESNIQAYYDTITNDATLTSSEKAAARAKATNKVFNESIDKYLQDAFKNSEKISQEFYENLKQVVIDSGHSVEEFESYFTQEKGSNELQLTDISGLIALLQQFGITIQQATIDAGNEAIEKTIDSFLKEVSNATSLVTKGTTSQADEQSFVEKYNKLMEEIGDSSRITSDEAFTYDTELKADTLNSDVFKKYIEATRTKLKNLDWSEERINQYINDLTNKTLAEAVDIDNFLKAENREVGSQAYNKLVDQMRDYYSTIYDSEEEVNERVQEEIEAISKGGRDAAAWIQVWAQRRGQKASSSDIETAYRASISQLEEAFDQLSYGVGSIVSGEATKILKGLEDKGYKLRSIGGGSAIIESVGNVTDAYLAYYEKLKANDAATFAALNEAYAKVLETSEGTDVIAALGDAASMTYTRLGEILASKGIELTDGLLAQYSDTIQSIGGGKVRITNFDRFATEIMQWTDKNSEEYVSAFKTYNDSLIEMNRKAERNIVEEVQKLETAQVGDQINLTQLVSGLGVEVTEALAASLKDSGALLENGILTLEQNANIPAIIQNLSETAAENGLLLQDSMAQLADTLNSVLKNYTSLINNGIEGSLTNTQAQQLQTQAQSLGYIGKLDFTPTANGLKLSEESARRLYEHLRSVDSLKANLVFDKLYESITDSHQGLKTISGTMAEIAKAQKQIEKENNKLKEQLSLYEQIRNRQRDDASSYDFMGQDLPEAFKGAENYWNSVGSAFKAMNEAGESGTMAIQDFYNIVNEMNNLAAISGNKLVFMGETLDDSAETAANLIEKGFSALSNVDGSGVAIDLKKLGVQFQNGAADMQSGFQGGIKAMAQSQIDMLDAMIALMETVVAMQELGKVDIIDENGILSVDEIFSDETDDKGNKKFTATYDKVREYLANSEELQPLLDDLKVHGVSLRQLLDENQDAWRQAGISEDEYAKIMTAFYQASISDNYDLENLISSVLDVLSGTGEVFSYYDKESGIETVIDASGRTYSVNWNKEEDKQRIYEAFKAAGYKETPSDEKIREILDRGQAGDFKDQKEIFAYQLTYGLVAECEVDGETKYQDSKGGVHDTIEEAVVENAFIKQKGEAQGDRKTIETSGKVTGYQQEYTLESGLSYTLNVGVDGKEEYSTVYNGKNGNEIITGSTYQEMIDTLLNRAANETYDGKDFSELASEEQIQLKRKLNIETTPEIFFTGTDGKEYDPSTDPEIQQKIQAFLNQSHDKIQQALEQNEDGSYIVTFLDGSKLTVKAENEDEAITKVQQAVDPLITSISSGIKSAFTDDPDNAIGKAIGDGIVAAMNDPENFKDKDFSVPTANATLDEVIIDDVVNAKFADDLWTNIKKGVAGLFGGDTSDLTIPEATAKVETLTLSKPTTTNFTAVEEGQSNATIDNLTADVTKLTLNAPTETDAQAAIDAATTAGQDINAGLVEGMSDTTAITEKAAEVGTAAVNAINTAAGTHSPSTITTQTGKDLVAGLIAGLSDEAARTNAVSQATSLAQQIIDAIQSYFNQNPLSLSANLNTPETPAPKNSPAQVSTPSVDISGITALQNAISTISTAGISAAAEIQKLSTNLLDSTTKTTDFETALSNIGDNGKTKAEDFETALSAIGDNGKNKADEFETALSNIKDNGKNKADEFQDALSKIGDNGKKKADDFAAALDSIKQDGINYTNSFKNSVNDIEPSGASIAHAFKEALNGIYSSGPSYAEHFKSAVNNMSSSAASYAANFVNAANRLDSNGIKVNLDIDVNVKGSGGAQSTGTHWQGNYSYAKGNQGLAYSGGKDTLMGELGPELVVSHGRYFLVGQNGPEMVKLDDDAIVFNHLQTKKLIEKGKINSHGTPVTNERKATSMATGNVEGPALASASEVLAMLKQLREMWRSLRDATIKDLGVNAGKAGKTKNEGSGKTSTDKETKVTEKYTAGIESNVERWYNWLQAIEATQNKINKLTKEYNILEKEGVSTQEKLENLQQQYKLRQENKDTEERLAKEQIKYRNDVIDEANQGLMSAFYQADKETGQVYLANDDAFQKYVNEQRRKGLAVGVLSNVMAQNGAINKGKTIKRNLSAEERKAKAEQVTQSSYGRQSRVPSYLKQYYKNGELIEGKEEEAKKAAEEEFKNSKYTKSVQITRKIKTGLDFMEELQAQDDAGNLVHDAADQLALIKQMGLFTEDLMTGIDIATEGWEAQVVQRFYDKVEEDKESIESLTDSIREQELAALDDAAAMEEINEKIRSITKVASGVTDGLEKWYNETKKIQASQQEINKLVKEMELLQKDQKINGDQIYQSLKNQENSIKNQIKLNNDLIAKRKKEAQELKNRYKDLPIVVDQNGLATFSEKAIGAKNGVRSVTTSYTKVKTNAQGYEVDVNGNYRDKEGNLRDKTGKIIEGNFGELAVENVTGHENYNFANKNIIELLNDLTSQDIYGETNFKAQEQYQILKAAGLEKYMQYDEKGNKIYDDFGALTQEEMEKAVSAAIKRIQNSVNEINTNNDEIVNLDEEQLKLQSDLLSIQQQLIDNQIEVEKMVKDAIEQLHQDAIDAKKELKDALDEASSRTIEGLQNSLDAEKSMYEKTENENQLAVLQRQLEVAQRSGASMSKIQNLQEQVASAQKDMYFTNREQLIDNIENSMQRELEALDTQISIMEATFEYQKENGLLWAEINEVLKNTPAAIIDFISQHTPALISASETDRLNQLNTIGDKITEFKAYQENKDKKEQEAKIEIETESKNTPEQTTPKNEEKEVKTQATIKADNSEIQVIDTEDDFILPEVKQGEIIDDPSWLALNLDESLKTPNGLVWEETWNANKNKKYDPNKKVYGVKDTIDKAKKIVREDPGISENDIIKALQQKYADQIVNKKDSPAYIAKMWNGWSDSTLRSVLRTELKKNGKVPKFKEGGDIDFSGLAWVDGTKKEPEHIFNFQQMEALRAHLLNGVDVTRQAISGLSDTLNQIPNINTYNSINNTTDSGISIGTLEFHMEVAEIANDYDARRAGEQAMNEIVRIARKSGTRSLSRR